MEATEIILGIVMLLQISIGVLVNVFFLLFYSHMVSISHRTSSSDLILLHLTLANTLILLTSGIPQTMSVWGQRKFLNIFSCKILIYLYRVARGIALCTTCLLSVFQAISISPSTSWWAGVKAKLPKFILISCLLFWPFNMLIYVSIPMYITGPQNSSSVRIPLDLNYCSTVSSGVFGDIVIAVVLSLRDLFFVGVMSVANGCMVFVLHQHHRHVQYLHGSSHSPRKMPEVRAAKRVIVLVMLYILIFVMHSIMLSILLNNKENYPLLVNSHMVLSFTFSAISPFLMIHSDQRMRKFWKNKSVSSTDPS
ncbi:vomeronasal 1 receptor ornAnaV1R3137 [Ornithorhynchus anatinus]|uniref:Vomeronasal type-1 receptor n=1 Tax=Ornithorhynchus anatinus TaxID=9258 RepID=A0A6I8NKV7_ORNAN|nr:vomeronasal 1 receptor ornAnaV1R3137 [Ornithorhynchus anatinus]